VSQDLLDGETVVLVREPSAEAATSMTRLVSGSVGAWTTRELAPCFAPTRVAAWWPSSAPRYANGEMVSRLFSMSDMTCPPVERDHLVVFVCTGQQGLAGARGLRISRERDDEISDGPNTSNDCSRICILRAVAGPASDTLQ
jgi:hypothetical protein